MEWSILTWETVSKFNIYSLVQISVYSGNHLEGYKHFRESSILHFTATFDTIRHLTEAAAVYLDKIIQTKWRKNCSEFFYIFYWNRNWKLFICFSLKRKSWRLLLKGKGSNCISCRLYKRQKTRDHVDITFSFRRLLSKQNILIFIHDMKPFPFPRF